MNSIVQWCFLSSALTLAGAGCAGTDVGNPFIDVDLTLYNDSFEPGAASRANGLVHITSGWGTVSDVRLRSGVECADERELTLERGIAVNLIDPGSPAALSGLEVPPGDYCQFSIRLNGLMGPPPAGAPAELRNAALVLSGSRADGTPFLLVSDQDEELLFDARDGVFAVSEMTNALVVGFDAVALFTNVDLDGAIVGGDGVIHISPAANQTLLDQFQSNLDAAAVLFDDDNGDGRLEPDERDDDDILGD